MSDRWGEDPTRRLWERWRRPVLAVIGLLFAARQLERILSGEPFVVITGIGLAAFWISLIWLRVAPPIEQRTDPDAWRAFARTRVLLFGFWSVVACLWLGAAAYLYGVRPANFVALAIPASLLAINLFTLSKPDKIAGAQRKALTP